MLRGSYLQLAHPRQPHSLVPHRALGQYRISRSARRRIPASVPGAAQRVRRRERECTLCAAAPSAWRCQHATAPPGSGTPYLSSGHQHSKGVAQWSAVPPSP
eukprot:3939214-Rhodomonas_salina.1